MYNNFNDAVFLKEQQSFSCLYDTLYQMLYAVVRADEPLDLLGDDRAMDEIFDDILPVLPYMSEPLIESVEKLYLDRVDVMFHELLGMHAGHMEVTDGIVQDYLNGKIKEMIGEMMTMVHPPLPELPLPLQMRKSNRDFL